MAKLVWRKMKNRKSLVKKATPVKKKAEVRKIKKAAAKPQKKPAKKKIVKKSKPVSKPKIAKKISARKTKSGGLPVRTTVIEKFVAEVQAGRTDEHLIEASKFNIGVLHNAEAIVSKDIPLEYGKNNVMLLIVDPMFAFTYWEVRDDSMREAAKHLGTSARLILRFYDTTGTNNPDESNSWDVEVFDRLGNWYLKLERPDQRICLDVGMKNSAGEFYRFARSNVMKLPTQSLARPGPIQWMIVTPSGEKLISDIEEYTDADLDLLKKILGPYFFDLLMRGRFASLSGSSIEAIFFDVSSLKVGESPSGAPPWGKQ